MNVGVEGLGNLDDIGRLGKPINQLGELGEFPGQHGMQLVDDSHVGAPSSAKISVYRPRSETFTTDRTLNARVPHKSLLAVVTSLR